MQIKNHTFIVTGGGSGLGEGTVRMIVENGGNAVIADVNEAAGKALVEELGVAVSFAKTDVTSEDDVLAAIDLAVSTYGSVQGVINCAGVGNAGKVVGKEGPHPLDLFQRVININLIGSFNVLSKFAYAASKQDPVTSDGERGIVINTASVAAFDGQYGQAAYSASKAGVVGMVLPIARELAQHGIRVNTIAPGIFETAMMQGMPDNVRDSLAMQVPFPSRFGQPSEYASLVKQMIENSMFNGECVRLDGSIRMAAK